MITDVSKTKNPSVETDTVNGETTSPKPTKVCLSRGTLHWLPDASEALGALLQRAPLPDV